MSTVEDKLNSLFRRVRRLQQSAFAIVGSVFEDSSGLSQIRVLDLLITSLQSPFFGFSESLSFAFTLVVKFGGRHIGQSFDVVPRLMILIDAYKETMGDLAGLMNIMMIGADSVSLSEALNYINLWLPAETEVTTGLIVGVKLTDLFEQSALLWMIVSEQESVALSESYFIELFGNASTTAYSALGAVIVKLTDTLTNSGLLWMTLSVAEAVDLTETLNAMHLWLPATGDVSVVAVILASALITLSDTFGVTPFIDILSIFSESLTVGESSVAHMIGIAGNTLIETLGWYLTLPLSKAVSSAGLLWAMMSFSESVDIEDVEKIIPYMLRTSTMVDGFYLLLKLTESLQPVGLLNIGALFDESVTIGDTDTIGVIGIMTNSMVETTASVVRGAFQDIFGVTRLLNVTGIFSESISAVDTFNMLVGTGIAGTSISVALVVLGSVPSVVVDSFNSLKSLLAMISGTDSMSVADALDYVDMRSDTGGDVSVNYECIKSCPSCYNCDGCEYCNTCDGCDAGACDTCNTCQGGCDNCDQCEGCDESCQTACQTCDNCISCITCVTCVTCVNCQACNICEFCDGGCNTCYTVCDNCDNCDGCQVCNTCDNCDNCDNCDGTCYTCNQSCYLCDSCDTCDSCATCDSCMNCYSSCEQCDDFCQTCATCYASCYACDECNNSCELCYQE